MTHVKEKNSYKPSDKVHTMSGDTRETLERVTLCHTVPDI